MEDLVQTDHLVAALLALPLLGPQATPEDAVARYRAVLTVLRLTGGADADHCDDPAR